MKHIITFIYNNSPIWLQNFIISYYGKKIYKERYSDDYFRFYNIFKTKKYNDLKNELELQTKEFLKLLKHAVSNSTFYKEFYKNIDLNEIKNIDDIKKLPILEKETLRANIEQVYTIDEKAGISSFTGGTTGKSLKVIFTKKDFQKRMAYLDAFKYRLGVNPFKSKKATFSGREFTNKIGNKRKIFWRYNKIYNQKLYSTFDLSDDNIPYYIEDLNQFKPDILNGFVSALYQLAEYINRNNIKIAFQPKAIFTTSETLLPNHRELIESVFNSKVYNQYASAEGAPFITECKHGNLHYNIDTGIIEPYKTEYGTEMLVTSFTTYGTPLIRYRIGDKIEFKEGTCSCGSCHPLVKKIEGRQVEYLISKEKGKISLSHLADVIKGMPNSIVNMQFIQNSIDEITVKLVVDESLYNPKHEKEIVQEMIFRFGKDTKITLQKVKSIPREKSGKFALIKNTIHS